MMIHRQNAGPTNRTLGTAAFNPYIDAETKRRSITIDGDAQGFAGTVIPKFTLYNKLSDGKFAPRFVNAVIAKVTNSTNMVCDVPNALRAYLAVNDKVRFYDVSAAALSASPGIVIDAISAADGGDLGAGYTKITCTGEVFGSTPLTGSDLLVLADGSEIDTDLVLVDEEVDLADSVDQSVSASYDCIVKKSLIERADYVNKADLAGRHFYIREE